MGTLLSNTEVSRSLYLSVFMQVMLGFALLKKMYFVTVDCFAVLSSMKCFCLDFATLRQHTAVASAAWRCGGVVRCGGRSAGPP